MSKLDVMPGLEIVTGVETYQLPQINPQLHSLNNTSTIKGLETYSMTAQLDQQSQQPQSNGQSPLILVTPDKKNASIYLNSVTMLSEPKYMTPLTIFLDNAPATMTIDIYLGSCVDDYHTVSISSILASIQACKAIINTHAYGMCSIPETMIWCYGKNRDIGDYGCIRFGGGEWIRRMEKVFTPYIQTYMDKCKEIGVLSDKQITEIIDKQKEIMFIKDNSNGTLIPI